MDGTQGNPVDDEVQPVIAEPRTRVTDRGSSIVIPSTRTPLTAETSFMEPLRFAGSPVESVLCQIFRTHVRSF